MALSGGWRRHDHARHMSAGRTLIGNQSRLTGDRSDGHHVLHGRSAFCTGRSANVRFTAPLFTDSVFIRHGTRPFRQGCCNVFLPEGNGVSEHWFSARHSESEDRRFRFAQPLPQDVLHFGERGWLATASSRLAGCRRPSIGLEQASASQNDICTRRLRAMRSSGAEISASISFAQTWPATFDLNSRRTVNVRPLTS